MYIYLSIATPSDTNMPSQIMSVMTAPCSMVCLTTAPSRPVAPWVRCLLSHMRLGFCF